MGVGKDEGGTDRGIWEKEERGWRKHLFWKEQLGLVPKGELPVMPENITGGIRFAYASP